MLVLLLQLIDSAALATLRTQNNFDLRQKAIRWTRYEEMIATIERKEFGVGTVRSAPH